MIKFFVKLTNYKIYNFLKLKINRKKKIEKK